MYVYLEIYVCVIRKPLLFSQLFLTPLVFFLHCRAELEKRKEKFDIIVGDLADPVEGGPCYQLYTKSFYDKILKPKLNENGIFVTQV